METQPNHDFLFVASATLALVFAVLAYVGWRKAAQAAKRAQQLEIELASSGSYIDQIDQLKAELERAVSVRIEAEKQMSIAQERVSAASQRMQDWEKQREESLQAARATIMQVGNEMSSKLLDDHKREVAEAKAQNEKMVSKTTQELTEKFSLLTQSVATIQDREQRTAKQMETVMRALTSPGGAGQLAEIGIENSLKKLGLIKGQDYFTQVHTTGEEGNLKPDFVVRLPQDLVIVIDAKASKFFHELDHAKDAADEAVLLQRLIKSAHTHLNTLTQKQYTDAVARMLKEQGHVVGRTINVMCLPSDAMLEKLRVADITLADKADQAGIVLAGPSSLAGLLSLARQYIAEARRDENQHKIIGKVAEVMDSFVRVLSLVDGIGKGIKSSASSFDELAKSVNSRLLPRLRHLQAMGVELPKNKTLPQSIKSYEVRDSFEMLTIEADEADAALALEDRQSA